MSRSSARRGLVEPIPALAAVLVVGMALGVYADAVATVEPNQSADGRAAATLQRVHDDVSVNGAVRPGRVADAGDAAPAGYDLNVTVTAGEDRWSTGPGPPDTGAVAQRRTGVRIDRWSVRPGRIRVVVWS
jgi:hypothetical protein